MNNIIKRVWNQNKMVNIEALQGMTFQAESGGHTFQISGVDDTGAAVPLSGTVAGVFMRPDRADIALVGSASDGVVSVTLTDDCYAVPGRFGLTIFVTSGGQKTAVYAAVGTVSTTSGGGVAGDTPQDVVDLINAIEAAVATIPADYTDLMAALAPTYSPSAVYPIGFYVWYNGDLYRCKTAITTAETWTAAHWTAATMGNDVSDMKTALNTANSLSGLKWYNGYYNQGDGSFVSNIYFRMSNAIPCTAGDTFIYCGNSSQANRAVIVFFDRNGTQVERRASLGTDYTEINVVVPDGAEWFRVLANANNIEGTYIIYGINAGQNPIQWNRRRIIAVENDLASMIEASKTAYVDGASATNGTGTMNDPFNSIISAVEAGYRKVKAKSGIYTFEQLRIENDSFDLSLWSNIESFDTTVPNREKIKIFKGDILTPTASNNLLTASYTPRSGCRFEKVFVDKTLSPIDSSFTYAEAYNANLFLWKDGHKARRYKPVLYENFTGAAGTFTYNNGTVTVSPFASDSDSDLKIYITDDVAFPLYFSNTEKLTVSDIVVLGAWYGGLQAHGCQDVTITDCDFICTTHGDGFECWDSNVTLENCVASGCAQDGYGFQHYGDSTLSNCSAFYSGDDGVSHHRGCTGVIDGGEWAYCESGGVTPAFGADVDVKNIYAHDNDRGLQYFGSSEYETRNVSAVGCVCVGNNVDVFADTRYNIVLANSSYGTKNIGVSASLTEYGNTVI